MDNLSVKMYSDVLLCESSYYKISVSFDEEINEEENRTENVRVRCYDGCKWNKHVVEKKERVNDVLNELSKNMLLNTNLSNDIYVKQQRENRNVYSVENVNYEFNKYVMVDFVKRVYTNVRQNVKIEDVEICLLSKCEKKEFTNSCGSKKMYKYSADGMMVVYSVKKNGYQGMIRLYGPLLDRYEEIMQKINAQIEKDVYFASNQVCLCSGKYDCVLSPEVAGILVHECLGHMSESDNCDYKWKLGKCIGQSFINVVDNGNMNGSGYTPFDDEGIDSQETYIVKDGRINSALTDIYHSNLLGVKSSGNGRSKSNEYPPIVRMTNTYMKAGNWSLHQLFHGIEYGIYVEECLGATIGEKIHVKPGRAYLIRKGRIEMPISICEITGRAFELIGNIEKASDKVDMCNDVFGGCGKRDQTPIRVSYGGPYLKINNVEIIGGNSINAKKK